MKNLGQMMKQVQEMQARMQEMQQKLEQARVTGRSGGGLVEITLTGKGVMQAVAIDPSLMTADGAEMLEDLVLAAHADARTKMEALMSEELKSATGGLPLPAGFNLPF